MKEYLMLVVIKNIQTKQKWNITMYLLELLKLKRLTKPSVGDKENGRTRSLGYS